jgi:Gluconate 2-dehydrogenase subunit 3
MPGPATGGRFPGFDVLDLVPSWDPATASVVLSRLGTLPDLRFFTPAEEAAGRALCDRLLAQDGEQRVPVLDFIDARLADGQTDGWRYEDMPEDGQAWRESLSYLNEDAQEKFGQPFACCLAADQRALIQAIQDAGSARWHDLTAAHVWSLWTRYACTAFYGHPQAWSEIGFPGPAYPRGYKNPGVDTREPFEVPDAAPADDPTRGSS